MGATAEPNEHLLAAIAYPEEKLSGKCGADNLAAPRVVGGIPKGFRLQSSHHPKAA